MSAPTPAVVARGLVVGYGSQPVVSGIEIALPRGQALALVGTNGSGKSTLLKTLVGLLAPLGGTVEVLGGAWGSAPGQVGYVGQFHTSGAVLPLQARDVVMMGRYARHGLLGRITRVDHDAVGSALERMGVADLAARPLRTLSGGQQQRVYLAQALAKEADILILDEPTAGLDAGSAERYHAVVQEELGRGATVITATHDIREAQRCDQAMLLAGRVVAAGAPAEVLSAERLLDAFGIALLAVPHRDHEDLVVVETPHGHAGA